MAKKIAVSRRQLLRGAAGFSLTLPFLPSLASKNAYAEPLYVRRPRLFWFTTDHGGAWETNMFPGRAALSTRTSMFSDHAIASGAIAATRAGGRATVSPILSAKDALLTNALARKMNVLWGLDIPFYIAHNTGGHLGNYAKNDGNGNDATFVQQFPRPTIDQIMAYSPSFYPDLGSVALRSMVVGDRPVSWNWSDPSHKSGPITNVRAVSSSLELFRSIYTPKDPNASTRPPVVDRVLESYQSLRTSNKRLSAADKQRLDDYMDRLAELQRRIHAGSNCSDLVAPSDDASSHQALSPADATLYGQLFVDLIVAAFMCGASRIAVFGYPSEERLAGYTGDWHQDVAHQWQTPAKQALIASCYQRFFETIFLYAASKLDVEEMPGSTYLDNSLLVWSQESGMETHNSVSMPIVTFGSSAGYFKTGIGVDYRRYAADIAKHETGVETQYLGVPYSRWLANVLLAMRVPPSEFERWGHKGYGYPHLGSSAWEPPWAAHYGSTSSRYFQGASDPLPLLKA